MLEIAEDFTGEHKAVGTIKKVNSDEVQMEFFLRSGDPLFCDEQLLII